MVRREWESLRERELRKGWVKTREEWKQEHKKKERGNREEKEEEINMYKGLKEKYD